MKRNAATLVRVIDADTLLVSMRSGPVDCGELFGYVEATRLITLRLQGLDAYRKGTELGDRGIEVAKLHLNNVTLWIDHENKLEKYGRLLCQVRYDGADGLLGDYNKTLFDLGLAVSWGGKGPRPAGLKDKGE